MVSIITYNIKRDKIKRGIVKKILKPINDNIEKANIKGKHDTQVNTSEIL